MVMDNKWIKWAATEKQNSRGRPEEQCDEAILNVIFSTFLCAFFPFSTENGIHFTTFLSSLLLLQYHSSEFPRSLQNTPELHPGSSCAGVPCTLKQKSVTQDGCCISGGTPLCFSFPHDIQPCHPFNA